MGTAKHKQDQLWELGQERGQRPVLESLLRRYYPEQQGALLGLTQKYGDEAVFESILNRMMQDGHLGEPYETPGLPEGDTEVAKGVRPARYRPAWSEPSEVAQEMAAMPGSVPQATTTTETPIWEQDPTLYDWPPETIDPATVRPTHRVRGPEGRTISPLGYEMLSPRGEMQVKLRQVPRGIDPEGFWRDKLRSKYYPEAEIDNLMAKFRKGHVPVVMLDLDLPEWEAPFKITDLPSAAKVLGRAILHVPFNTGARFLTATQGWQGASVVHEGIGHWLVNKVRESQEGFEKSVVEQYRSKKLFPKVGPFPGIRLSDLAAFADGLAFSTVSLGTGAVAGVLGSAVTTPAGGVAIGSGAAAATAYRMATYEVMQSYLEMKNEEMIEKKGRDITAAEEKALKEGFSSKAQKYGLWEAIFEGIGAGAWGMHVTKPLFKITGSMSRARLLTLRSGRGIAKFGAMLAEETGTETLTELFQQNELVGTGMPEAKDVNWSDPREYVTAMQQVAPQTLLLTVTMAGGGQALVSGMKVTEKVIKQRVVEEVGTADPYYEPIIRKVEAVAKGDKQIAKDMIDNYNVDPTAIEEGAQPAEEVRAETPISPEQESPLESRIREAKTQTMQQEATALAQAEELTRQLGEEALTQPQEKPVPSEVTPSQEVVAPVPEEVEPTLSDGRPLWTVPLSEYQMEGRPSELTRISELPARTLGFNAVPDTQVDAYIKAVERVVRQYAPEAMGEFLQVKQQAQEGPGSANAAMFEKFLGMLHQGTLARDTFAREIEATGQDNPINAIMQYHREAVEKALAEGKQVPDVVLASYPDIRNRLADEAKAQELEKPLEERSVASRIEAGEDITLEQWTAEENAKRAEEREAAGQVGGVDFSRAKRSDMPVPENPTIQQAVNAWKDSAGWLNRTVNSLGGALQRFKDFMTAEQDPELRRAGFVQFQDDVRTGYIPIMPRARHRWITHKMAIYGNLSHQQKESFFHLLALRDISENQRRGIPAVDPDGNPLPPVQDTLSKFEADLEEKAPEVLEAGQRFRDFNYMVSQEELVDRNKLEDEDIHADYFPNFNLDYLPEWWDLAPFAQKMAQEPLRRYTIQRHGGGRRIAYNETALDVHYTSLFADNMMEDWSLEQLQNHDISNTLAPEEKAEVYGVNHETGKRRKLKHGMTYKYNGQDYLAMRYERGNARWGYEANLDLLEEALEDVALDVDRLLTKETEIDINKLFEEGATEQIEQVISRSPEEQKQMLRRYLLDVGPRGGNAYRRALILGRNVKTYLVPKPIGNKLMKLHSPLGIRWLRPFMRATSLWKGATLGPFAASLPFMATQLVGDGSNTYRNNPRALSPDNIMSAIRIIAQADPLRPSWTAKLPYLDTPLTATEERTRRIAQDKDIFGSAFFREYDFFNQYMERMLGNKPATDFVSSVITGWGRSNSFREAILRVATAHENVKRVERGEPVWMPEFKHLQPYLDVESQIGMVARRVNVDYLATPEYYNRFIRGLMFPFATFHQKNAVNWANYIRFAPAQFMAKFVAPYVGADFYNHEKHPEVEALLPDWVTSRFHIIINSWDYDKDGLPDRARVFAPQLPLDMAIQATGLHTARSKIAMMMMKDAKGRPIISPEEAAREQLKEMFWGESGKGLSLLDIPEQLVSPMAQALTGILRNRDSFTKRRIVPKNMMHMPTGQKWKDYYAPYILEKMVTPIGQYMRATRGDDKVFGAFPSKAGDIASGASRYIRQTFNPMRGFGIYEIDLNRQLANQLMQPAYEAENLADAEVGKIVADYISSGLTAEEYISSPAFLQAVQYASDEGIALVSQEHPNPIAYIYSKIKQPWVEIDRLGRLRNIATSKRERRAIDDEIKQNMYKIVVERYKGVDTKAKPNFAKGLEEYFNDNPWLKPEPEK